MKLLKLDMKNFGKFHNRKIELQDGVNLIYGENESGKSTIHTFIRAMLFGLERGRGRASVNDTFSRYEPWENGNYYAGSLEFECGGKVFCLQRNFDKYSKKTTLTCETDGEAMSAEDGDLDVLLDGLSESSYKNTLYMGQMRAPAGQELADELKNYAASYFVAGDSDINLLAAREQLLEKKKEADREVKRLLLEKQKKREMIEQEASYVWREIHHIDSEMEDIRSELELRKEQGEENDPEGKQEREWRKISVIDMLRPAKWRIHPIEIIVILAAIVGAFTLLPGPWNAFVTVIVALLGTIYTWNRMKIGKNHPGEEEREISEDFAVEDELVSTGKLNWELEHLAGERGEKQVEYDNLREQLQEMDEMDEEYREIDRKREALLLAVRRLEEVSSDMQKQMAVLLNRKASGIIAGVTGGRYDRLVIEENLHMSVFCGSRCVPMEQLSRGTVEQIYFALRMAAADILYDENYPVILDDTFAFYDDIRLAETLKWLSGCGRQVIIFSCQDREEKAMKRNGICYAKTVL